MSVTAAQPAAAPRRFFGLLGPKKPPVPLITTGQPARFRPAQKTVWGAAGLAFGAAVVAGIYFNWLQVRWHVDVGPVHAQWWYLKQAWDGWNPIPRLGSWTLFRHGYRNDGEPALATMFMLIATAAGGATLGSKVGRVRLITGPFILVALAFALITGAIWLQFYGLPHAWHALGLQPVDVPRLAKSWGVAETFVFGFIVGHALKFYWMPIAGHLQNTLMDRSVDKFWHRQGIRVLGGTPAGEYGVIESKLRYPLWVRYPIAPVGVRETFSRIVREDMQGSPSEAVQIIRSGRTHQKVKGKWARRAQRTAFAAAGFVLVYYAVTGALAHFYIGTGHNVPYFAPAHAQAVLHYIIHYRH